MYIYGACNGVCVRGGRNWLGLFVDCSGVPRGIANSLSIVGDLSVMKHEVARQPPTTGNERYNLVSNLISNHYKNVVQTYYLYLRVAVSQDRPCRQSSAV